MFLITFVCTNECFSGENNLETHPVIEFSFNYVAGIRNLNQILYVSLIVGCFMKWLCYASLERFQITLNIVQIYCNSYCYTRINTKIFQGLNLFLSP